MNLKNIATKISQFIYPKTCINCNAEEQLSLLKLCNICTTELEPLTELDLKHYLENYLSPLYSECFILYDFNESIKALIHQIKYNHGKNLARNTGIQLAKSFKHILEELEIDIILPCPLHSRKKKEREYNQAFELSLGIEHITSIPVRQELMKRTKYTKTQTQFSKEKREKNLKNAFYVDDISEYKSILIVDDVATTGTTLKSIGNILKQKNPEIKLYAAAISTPLL